MQIGERTIDQVTVIGAGFIGLGWTVVYARAGLKVCAHDADAAQLKGLRSRVDGALALLCRSGWLSEDEAKDAAGRVRYSADLAQSLEGTSYVQECVPEDVDLKRAVFEAVDAIAPTDVIIGSSTSGIPMTEIAAHTRRPERCVVVHPTNPPHIVPLVEIVPGERTSAATVDTARDLMEAVGQQPIVCRKEVAGFVLNRLQFALEREAFYLAREGVASVADIDRAVSEGLGLRWALMGPFLVEETNAANVRDDLTKFGPAIQELMELVCQPFEALTADDIDRTEAGVNELMGTRTHDDYLAYRDELILRIRGMKRTWTPSSTTTQPD